MVESIETEQCFNANLDASLSAEGANALEWCASPQ
jgi:hypothetical protein